MRESIFNKITEFVNGLLSPRRKSSDDARSSDELFKETLEKLNTEILVLTEKKQLMSMRRESLCDLENKLNSRVWSAKDSKLYVQGVIMDCNNQIKRIDVNIRTAEKEKDWAKQKYDLVQKSLKESVTIYNNTLPMILENLCLSKPGDAKSMNQLIKMVESYNMKFNYEIT